MPKIGRCIADIRFKARPDKLRMVREVIGRCAKEAGCGDDVVAEIVIAVNEACMNVIQHAYQGDPTQSMSLTAWTAAGELICRIEDSADPADLDQIKPRDLEDLRPSGLGTHFMSELMDDCRYGHLEGGTGNFLEMRKRIA